MKTEEVVKDAVEYIQSRLDKFEWSKEAQFLITHNMNKWVEDYTVKTDEFLQNDRLYVLHSSACALLEDDGEIQKYQGYLEPNYSTLDFFWDKDGNDGELNDSKILSLKLVRKLMWHINFKLDLSVENCRILSILLDGYKCNSI